MTKIGLYYDGEGTSGGVQFSDRWNDLASIIDFDPNHSVLDIGCAEGLISFELSKRFKTVTAFDSVEHRIKIAKENFEDVKNLHFFTATYRSFKYKMFDQIFMLGVYHKVKMRKLRIRTLNKILKHCNSTFYFRVPVAPEHVEEDEYMPIFENHNFVVNYKSQPRDQHGTLYKFTKTICF